MHDHQIRSLAFARAILKSERVRIISLLAAVFVLSAIIIARDLLPSRSPQYDMMIMHRGLAIITIFAIYEFMILVLVNRAIKGGFDPPGWLWIFNIGIETLLPTSILFAATLSDFPGPYRALVVPAVASYFVFIILSTLRLSPFLCILTGVLSGAGYFSVLVFTFLRFPDHSLRAGAFEFPIYATFPVFLIVGGVVAGMIAWQIRMYVLAALNEAEASRQAAQMKHDLDIARSIQQGLLPRRTPRIRGFDVAGWSRPADQTGGDYYDWQELPQDRLVVSLADVTGHGIGPALVTSLCRAYARASFLDSQELGALIDRVHTLLAEDLPPNRFVTFVATLLDEHSHTIQMLSAGHGPILLYSARRNAVHARRADGLPLGIMPEIAYAPARKVEFAPGDILVLITDGFGEWTNTRGEQYGTDRLCECLLNSRSLPAEQIIQRIHADVLEFAGDTEQMDDLTAVVIKRL